MREHIGKLDEALSGKLITEDKDVDTLADLIAEKLYQGPGWNEAVYAHKKDIAALLKKIKRKM